MDWQFLSLLGMMVVFICGYLVGFIQGRRYERMGWLRWVLSQIKNVRVEIEKEDFEDVLERGIG